MDDDRPLATKLQPGQRAGTKITQIVTKRAGSAAPRIEPAAPRIEPGGIENRARADALRCRGLSRAAELYSA